ncbi:WD repeat-containing protein 53 [Perkinsus olseni]|uniref:WD repeat-containing protein 53 n=1 Tax=Perkinsus olseni TaxID=32597 RepID=A0A7J6PDM1_PEROL|nr:WD repeat-containing protein 53 [Perkinsus olseni]
MARQGSLEAGTILITGDVSKECSVTALASQPGSPDMIWAAREDKCLLGIDTRSNVVETRITLPAGGELVGSCVASATSVYVGAESNILNYDTRKGLLTAAYVPQNQTNEVNNFSLSPDGSQLLVPTDEGELVFLNASTLAKCRETIRINDEEQVCSCVTARTSLSNPSTTIDVLTGGFDCTVRRFAVEKENYRVRGTLDVSNAVKDENSALPLAFNPPFVNCIEFDSFSNDSAVAGTGNGSLCLMKFRGDSINFKDLRTSILRIPAHSQAVADLTCLRGRRVASVGSDGRLALSSLLGSAPRVLQQVDLGWKPSAVRSVGTDGLTVVVGGVDGQLQCFDVRS